MTADPTQATDGHPVAGEESGSPPSAPSEAGPTEEYKGMQRQLNKSHDENRRLAQELEEARKVDAPEHDAVIDALAARLTEVDAEQGAIVKNSISTWRLQHERAAVETEKSALVTAARESEDQERDQEALRSVATDLGADPDSPMVDYGDADIPLAVRMERTRSTAKEAAKPVTPVEPPQPSIAQATAHSTQPGVPAAQTDNTITQAQVRAATDAMVAYPSEENKRRANDIQRAFDRQLFP